jgi:hypothetical protein
MASKKEMKALKTAIGNLLTRHGAYMHGLDYVTGSHGTKYALASRDVLNNRPSGWWWCNKRSIKLRHMQDGNRQF